MQDFFVFLIFMFLCVGFLLVSRKAYGDYFSPVGLFGFVQCFAIGMFHLKFFPYNPLTPDVWLCFLGALLFFMLGCLLVHMIYIGKVVSVLDYSVVIDRKKLLKATMFSFVLGAIGFVILAGNIAFSGGVEEYVDDPMAMREKFTIQYLSYPWFFNVITPSLALLYAKVTKSNFVVMLFIIVASWMMLILSFSRSLAIVSLCMMFFTVNYFKLYKNILRKAVSTVLICTFLFIAFHVTFKDPKSYEKIGSDDYVVKSLAYFAPIYGYFTIGLSIFKPYIDDVKDYDYGVNTFVTFAKVLHLFDDDIKVPEVHGKWYSNPTRGNVYTYLGFYYRDFGLVGVLLLPFLQGVLVMTPYMLMVRKGRYKYFIVNSYFSWCLLISFFSNHFRGNTAMFLALMGLLIGKYVTSGQREGLEGNAARGKLP